MLVNVRVQISRSETLLPSLRFAPGSPNGQPKDCYRTHTLRVLNKENRIRDPSRIYGSYQVDDLIQGFGIEQVR